MLAAPVPAHNNDPQSRVDTTYRQPHPDAFRSPMSVAHTRTNTPSVSPLSSTSKTNNDPAVSPTPADRRFSNGVKASEGGANANPGDQDPASRERSSSLSDIEDSYGEQIRDEQDASESEEAATPPADDANDSEAETERIRPTPHRASVSHPSKMSLGAPPPIVEEDAMSEAGSVRESEEGDSRPGTGLAGRKRKRGLLHKDSASFNSGDSDSDTASTKKRGVRRSIPRSSDHKAAIAALGEHTIDESDSRVASRSPTRGRSGSGKLRSLKQPAEDTKAATPVMEVEETAEQNLGIDEEGEEEEKVAPLTADEELARDRTMKSAINIWGALRAIRSRTCTDRIIDADHELEMLKEPHPHHPEYIRQLQAVTSRRDTKILQDTRLLQFKKGALRTQTLASRCQLLSQYMQDCREIRERTLSDLGKQWYDIQKERRAVQADELQQYTQAFPTKLSDQIRQQTRYNAEVSILSGVARYVGFPAAPEMAGLRPKDLENDLKAMKIARSQPQQQQIDHAVQQATPRQPVPASSAQQAEKDFIEQTPWANPNHPSHSLSRTPSALGNHSYEYQVPPKSYSIPTARPPSAYSTPQNSLEARPWGANHKAPGSNDTVAMPSDPPSSVHPAPPTGDRIRLAPYEQGDMSPTSRVKRGPSNKRDFSGVSSTSTIEMNSDPANAQDHRGYHAPEGNAGFRAAASAS